MSSEWMKVMLDEIARKNAEAEQAQIELDRRHAERDTAAAAAAPASTPADDISGGGRPMIPLKDDCS